MTDVVAHVEGDGKIDRSKQTDPLISIPLTKDEWLDILEALDSTVHVDVGEMISNKIRANLQKALGEAKDT